MSTIWALLLRGRVGALLIRRDLGRDQKMNALENNTTLSMKFYESDNKELKLILEIGKLLGRDFPHIERIQRIIEHNLNCDGSCKFTVSCDKHKVGL